MGAGCRLGGSPGDLRSDALNPDPPGLQGRKGPERSRLHVLIVLIAALVLGAGLGFDGAWTRNASASDQGESLLPLPVGMVITLENGGPSPITEAALGFDLPPIDPGQTLDVRIGDPGSPTDLGELQFGGSSVSRTNPLPPGGVGCIGPLSELVPGTHVDFEQIAWFGNGFSTTLDLAIVIDVSALPFDFAHPAVPDGALGGTWRFLSTVPPECGPSASVDMGVTDGVHQVNVTVTATDLVGNNEDIAVSPPFSVESGLPPSLPSSVGVISLVVTMAVTSSIVVLVRRRRRNDPDPPGGPLVDRVAKRQSAN